MEIQNVNKNNETNDKYRLLGDQNEKSCKERCLKCVTFSPLCCCCWCFVTTLIIVSITIMVVFLAIIPQLAQESTDAARFIMSEIHLSNATNDSILMNVSIEVTNTGSNHATIDSTITDVYLEDGSYIGTLKLPSIEIKGSDGGTIDLVERLYVDNVENFRVSSILVAFLFFCFFFFVYGIFLFLPYLF